MTSHRQGEERQAAPDPAPPSTSETAQQEIRSTIAGHLPALRNYALSLTHHPAEADDLLQETLLRVWRKADLYTPGSNLQSWLLTVMYRTFISGLRRNSRRERLETAVIDPVTWPAHDGRLALHDFLRAMEALSPRHREPVILVCVLGHSYEEAGRRMGLSPGTVKSRVSRARSQLLALLEPGAESGEGGGAA